MGQEDASCVDDEQNRLGGVENAAALGEAACSGEYQGSGGVQNDAFPDRKLLYLNFASSSAVVNHSMPTSSKSCHQTRPGTPVWSASARISTSSGSRRPIRHFASGMLLA